MSSKTRACEVHARRRLEERYGLLLSRNGWADIVRMIQTGKAAFIEKQSNRVSLFDVDYAGQRIRVVYDKQRKVVVTALPQGENK